MIKIRYRGANELSPGLHATAERHGRTITVYLLPGLTAAERNAALRRLQLSGRMGHGPRLPAVPLAFARFANRIRTTIAQAGSVFRTHPAGSTGPVMLISAGAIAFLVLSAVSIRILREPRGPDGSSASGPAPAASAIAMRIPGSSQHLVDDPAGSEGLVLTTAQSGSDLLPLFTSPVLPGNGSGVNPGTGTGTGTGITGIGSTGTGTGIAGTRSGTGAGGGGTTAGVGGGSTPNPTASAAEPGAPPVTVSVPAPSTSGSASVPASAPAPVPAPSPVSASAAPPVSASVPVSVSASIPSSVSASVAPSVSVSAPDLPSVSASVPVSVSASVPHSVSASVAPSVSVSVPASVYTSDPVTVSASIAVSASAAGSPASAQSPTVTVRATGGACLDVGPLGVCLGG